MLAGVCNNPGVPRLDDRAAVGERRLQVTLGLLFIGLTAITIAVFTPTPIGIAVVDEQLDLVINTIATIGALAIGVLAWARFRVTDEASAMELAGFPVQLIAASPGNLKVTVASDLKLAAWYLEARGAGSGR